MTRRDHTCRCPVCGYATSCATIDTLDSLRSSGQRHAGEAAAILIIVSAACSSILTLAGCWPFAG
jgi:hypothetical protein